MPIHVSQNRDTASDCSCLTKSWPGKYLFLSHQAVTHKYLFLSQQILTRQVPIPVHPGAANAYSCLTFFYFSFCVPCLIKNTAMWNAWVCMNAWVCLPVLPQNVHKKHHRCHEMPGFICRCCRRDIHQKTPPMWNAWVCMPVLRQPERTTLLARWASHQCWRVRVQFPSGTLDFLL